ncbi:hypothetical protein SDC9_18477 [bioreactor metagenome]|uniref:Uncharacterized protein n=1 Tax=bioreactor metagenome TaxID=1076179 RepID=A0A644U1B2_9ZZZZ
MIRKKSKKWDGEKQLEDAGPAVSIGRRERDIPGAA